MNEQKPTFKQAMQASMLWCQSWENDEISDEVISDRIGELIKTVEGARGFRSLVPSKGACVAGLSFTIIGLLSIVVFIIDGPGTDSEKPTSRVGPGDVNLDVIEIHSLWEPADIEVRNVGEEFVEGFIWIYN